MRRIGQGSGADDSRSRDPSQYEPIEPHISAEELQRRRQEPDFSTAEVLAYLEKL